MKKTKVADGVRKMMKNRSKRGKSKQPIVTVGELAALIGLASWRCTKCGKVHHGGEKILRDLFDRIVEKVLGGSRVQISRFGTFRITVLKGRTIISPICSTGRTKSKDRRVLRFTQSPLLKEKMNERKSQDVEGD